MRLIAHGNFDGCSGINPAIAVPIVMPGLGVINFILTDFISRVGKDLLDGVSINRTDIKPVG